MSGRVTVFGPTPLLGVTIEARGNGEDDVHLHAGGQGVWVARMAAQMGAHPILCGLVGGESGATLTGLLATLPGERRLVPVSQPSGVYVIDRRDGTRRTLANAPTRPPSRHEVDDLVSTTIAAALDSDVMAVCNAFPGDALPLDAYEELVDDVRANGVPVLVDLSTPRLEYALRGRPDLVKLNDWELAQYVSGPVETREQLRAGAQRLVEAGAGAVLVTRGGKPAVVLREGQACELVPPRLPDGHHEGCGDTMVGAMSAAWAQGASFDDAVLLGAAAGAANFLRHGLGTGDPAVVEKLRARVQLRAL